MTEVNIEVLLTKDSKTGMFFGFLVRSPGICAQGNTSEEVFKKIEKIKTILIKRNDRI